MSEMITIDGPAKYAKFMEAVTSNEFPSLLHSDYKDILLSAYASVPQPELGLCFRVPSNNEVETYRGLKIIQDMDDVVAQAAEIPEIMLGEKDTVSITNYKYARICSYTKEMAIYNKLAEFNRLATLHGEAMGRTVPKKIIAALETSGNYTAYGSSLTLTATNLEAMIEKFKVQTDTAADGTTVKLGLIPDTLLVPPELEADAKRLLMSLQIPGSANNDINVLKGSLNIVVSHYLSSSSIWYILKSGWANGLILQSVIGPPPEASIQDVATSEGPFRYDKISMKSEMIFGVGVIDAKYCLKSAAS